MRLHNAVLCAVLALSTSDSAPVKENQNPVENSPIDCSRIPYVLEGDWLLAPGSVDVGQCPEGCSPNKFKIIAAMIRERSGRIVVKHYRDSVIVDCKPILNYEVEAEVAVIPVVTLSPVS